MPQFRHGPLVDDLVARHLLDPIQHPLGRLGDEYEVLVENFTCVEAGEVFASAGGEVMTAEEPFYPVVLSARGTRGSLGTLRSGLRRVPDLASVSPALMISGFQRVQDVFESRQRICCS